MDNKQSTLPQRRPCIDTDEQKLDARDELMNYLEARLAQGLPITPGSLPRDIRAKCYRYGIFLPARSRRSIYRLFGLKPEEADIVTEKYLKDTYRRLIRKHHPDLNPDDPLACQRTNIIVKAFKQLMRWRKKLVCLLIMAASAIIFWR
jgi:hypothetical protein